MNQDVLKYKCIDYSRLLLLKGKSLSLTDQETHILLIMMTLHDLGIHPLTPEIIMNYSSLKKNDIDNIMLKLINKHILNRYNGMLDFKPLYRLLLEEENEEVKEVNLIDVFEDAFGRTLNHTEIEFINDYKRRGFDDNMIIDALRESVKSQALSFRYIDRVLENWAKYGVKKRNKPQESHIDISDEIKNLNWWDQ